MCGELYAKRHEVAAMYMFPLEKNERILKKGMATLELEEKTALGAVYLTTERLMFVGYEGARVTSAWEAEIPLVHIDEIKGAKTFALLPNVIEISTIRGQRFRLIIRERDEWKAAIEAQMEIL